MKNLLLTMGAAVILFACGPSEQPEANQVSNKVETPAAERVEEVVQKEGFIGSWTVDAATAGAKMDVRFNEDGSYAQSIGKQETSGTWKKIDDTHLEMMNPNLKNPQTWEIKRMTENTIDICWNPSSAKPLTIPFKRAE